MDDGNKINFKKANIEKGKKKIFIALGDIHFISNNKIFLFQYNRLNLKIK